MSFERAFDLTRRLEVLLMSQLQGALDARPRIAALDGEALLGYCAGRDAAQAELAGLMAGVHGALTALARAHALATVDLGALEGLGERGRALVAQLGRIRTAAGQVREADRINETLCRNALACLRAWSGRGAAGYGPAGRWASSGGGPATTLSVRG